MQRLAPETRIGQYTIIALVGSGGMGEVYRARDPQLGRDVAIKVLPADLATDRDRLARLQQEARTAGMLNHPNLLTVHELGVHDGAPFIVTELLEGASLRAVLAAGPLREAKVIDYGVQIAEGLAAAHAKNIVHRDLKPENIFVTRDDRVKILDFGLAKVVTATSSETAASTSPRLTGPGVVLGTTGYQSPEQVRGEALDARSDIFALGAMLHEMASGRRAFDGESRVETLHAILHDEPPPLLNISEQLQRVIRHCLEKHPADRFQCASDLAFALESSRGREEERRGAGARSWIAPALAAAMGLIAIAIAAWITARRPRESGVPAIQRLTFRNSNITEARFTADERTIIYSVDPRAGAAAYAVRTDNPESRPLGYQDASMLDVSGSGELLLKLRGQFAPYAWNTVGTLGRAHLSGSTPREVLQNVAEADWDSSGTNLALVRVEGGKYRIEFPPGDVRYETPGWVSHVRVSPDGKSVAFIDHPLPGDDTGSVALITGDRKMRKLTSRFGTAYGLAWHPDGREIWFSAGRTNRGLRAVDLSGRERTIYAAPGLLTLHDIAPDGRVLATLASARIQLILRRIDGIDRDLSWLDYSLPLDLSPDGATLLFVEAGQGAGNAYALYSRKTDGSAAIKLGEGGEARFSPDAKSMLVSSNGLPAQLFVYPVAAGEPRQVTNDSLHHEFACWFPDGQRIAFMTTEANRRQLYVQKLGERLPRRVASANVEIAWDAVSPDGRTILVRSNDSIGLLPAGGGEPHFLDETLNASQPLRWNASGSGFYFVRGRSPRVFEYQIESRRIRELPYSESERTRWSNHAAITPDGRSFAFDTATTVGELYILTGLR